MHDCAQDLAAGCRGKQEMQQNNKRNPECDAAVHRIYPLTGRLGSFIGGGDTSFVPVFDEAREDKDLGGIVYFTDGKCNLPEVWVPEVGPSGPHSLGAYAQRSIPRGLGHNSPAAR
jgi:hypothetical protein